MQTDKDTADKTATAPKVLSWNGEEYPVFALPNSAYLTIAETLDKPGGFVETLTSRLTRVQTGKTNADGEPVVTVGFNASDLIPLLPSLLPQALTALIPCASKLVSAAFRIDEKKIADEMPLALKVAALRLIAANEDFPAVWKTFSAMWSDFRQPLPALAKG